MQRGAPSLETIAHAIFVAMALFLVPPSPIVASNRLVINEIMINEPGNETSLEWVELFNPGEDSLDLQNYIFIEAADTTRFATRWVHSRDFVLLARKPLSTDGSSSFERSWGNASNLWGDDSLENYLLMPAKMSLRNTNDSVTIVELPTGKSETVTWASSPPDGVSLERVNPMTGPRAGNFKYCKAAAGSTPGAVNSVVAKMRDWGLIEDDCEIFVPPDSSQPLEFSLMIRNLGQVTLSSIELNVIHDRNFDGAYTGSDSLTHFSLGPLLPDSAQIALLSFTVAAGRQAYVMQLPDDDDLSNNVMNFDCVVGPYARELLLNEFVCNGSNSLGCEWIELQSVAEYELSLKGWMLEIIGESTPLDTPCRIPPGAKVILCEDSTCFRTTFTGLDCQLVQPDNWRPLDNTGGIVVLRMQLGALSDSVEYRGAIESGRSWERDTDATGGNFEALFYRSTSLSGSTPCNDNSIRPAPVAFDVGFAPSSLSLQKDSLDDSMIVASLVLVNNGYRDTAPALIRVFDDADHDSTAAANEQILAYETDSLHPGDSSRIIFSISASAGRKHLIFLLADDEVLENNSLSGEITVGPLTREILITELLADPANPLESEWVEIKNISGRAINLQGWSLGDMSRQHLMIMPGIIAPGQYLLVVQDSTEFAAFYGEGCADITLSSWSSLNNNGDAIILRDEFGTVSDSMSYAACAGANRSIERNESDPLAAASWYPSTALSGATPCAANSVSSQYSGAISLTLHHCVFAPSAGEELHFAIQCPPATRFTIEIFDLSGRRQRLYADAQYFSTGEFSYDGASDHSSHLLSGAYILKIEKDDGSFSQKVGFAVAPPR